MGKKPVFLDADTVQPLKEPNARARVLPPKLMVLIFWAMFLAVLPLPFAGWAGAVFPKLHFFGSAFVLIWVGVLGLGLWALGGPRRDLVLGCVMAFLALGFYALVIWAAESFHGAYAQFHAPIQTGLYLVTVGLFYRLVKLARMDAQTLITARRRGSTKWTRVTGLFLLLAFNQIVVGAYNAQAFWSVFDFVPKAMPTNLDIGVLIHRYNGYLLVVLSIFFWVWTRHESYRQWRFYGWHFPAATAIQAVIGIGSLHMDMNIYMTIAHHILGIALWILLVAMLQGYRYPRAQSIIRK